MATFNGGTGDDVFVGGIEPDQIKGGDGDDILFGLGGFDSIDGEAGDDILDGGGDPDLLVGGLGRDQLSGGASDDIIYAGLYDSNLGISPDRTSEADVLSGGSGDDALFAGYGDAIDGGSQTSAFSGDRLYISFLGAPTGVNADFRELASNPAATITIGSTSVTNVEAIAYLEGSEFGDTLAAYSSFYLSGYVSVYGRGGDDTIYAGPYSGGMYGGDGSDTIDMTGASGGGAFAYGEAGDDFLIGGQYSYELYGGDGNDRIDSLASRAYGGDGDDLLRDLGSYGVSMSGEAGNDILRGGSGTNYLSGGEGGDLIFSGGGAGDYLRGEAGDDRLYFGGDFAPSDVADGGDNDDWLVLQGDYTARASLDGGNFVAIERLVLLSAGDNTFGEAQAGMSFSYNLMLEDSALAAGGVLAIDGAGLTAAETLDVDGSAETNGRLAMTGGAGDDDLTGGGGADSVFLQKGGKDRAVGGGGNDGFFFGGAFTAADIVDGGAGTDTVALQGNYAAGATLTGVSNVEFLSLLSGSNIQFGEPGSARYSYSLTTTDANVQAGATLTVQATGLLAAENLIFNGAAETNGNFRIFAGQGADMLTGGAGSDGFFFGADGNLTGADRIDGGAGTDSIALRGNYAVTLQDAAVTNVEVLAFLSGHTNEYGGAIVAGGYDYDVTLANGNLAAGKSLDVVGSNLRADESLRFDGRAETDGSLRIFGGAGDDILYGGSQADTLFGGLGKDRLEGGAGADTYAYQSAAQSTSTGYDQIIGFDWHADKIDAPGAAARSFAQSAQGSLSTASFDSDLTAGMNGVLAANQAALFTANAGTLAGHIFAVIDVNGQAGYQAGQDLVIELVNPVLPIDPTAGVIV